MTTGNQIRIIGGTHRGRRLRFADAPGLRPTGDRVRETLFNWLQPLIGGAHCLDLFAGSGALGLEAASRGAGEVVMVERVCKVADQLRANVQLLRLEHAQVVQSDAIKWLESDPLPFDIVFLDPPFADDLLGRLLPSLLDGGWFKPNALVYLEADAKPGLPGLPNGLVLEQEKRMGQVAFGLARCAG